MRPVQATRALRFALARFAANGAAAVEASGFAAGLAGFIAQAQGQTEALRQAIADRRFQVLFQPVVALRSRAVHHYEALLRPTPMAGAPWQTTQEFVTCAEALGLAEELDLAVLRQVLAALDRVPGCSIATNISGQSMESEQFRAAPAATAAGRLVSPAADRADRNRGDRGHSHRRCHAEAVARAEYRRVPGRFRGGCRGRSAICATFRWIT